MLNKKDEFNELTSNEESVIIHKVTEQPFSGKYDKHQKNGTYICKRCNAPLYYSKDKFDASCGWPSFDDEILGAIKRVSDSDGKRTEILCDNCGAHLGHLFKGERFTEKNTRHCVNSISLNFKQAKEEQQLEKAIFAGGCFWGVEYYFKHVEGVISTSVGYIGGNTISPTYDEVSSNDTGHVESIEIVFDPEKVSYEELVILFFEIHDPTELNRQGPDIGDQYRSEIFYLNNEQKYIAEKLMEILVEKGYKVVTKISKASVFWKAEIYHQDYYNKTGDKPYCQCIY